MAEFVDAVKEMINKDYPNAAGFTDAIRESLSIDNKPATLAESASEAITENDITTDLSRELAAVNIINASNEPNINFLGQNRPVDQFQRFQPSTEINRYFL